MIEYSYAEYAWKKTEELLAIDSPSGYTNEAAEWVKNEFSSLGFDAKITVKGGVRIDLGGADENDALFLEAHADTLGGMVGPTKVMVSGNTLQVKDYGKYGWTMFDSEAKKARHEEVFPKELEKASSLGAEMVKAPWNL